MASSVKINKTLAWVHFPSLNIAYYDEEVLMPLAEGTGKLVKINFNTLQVS